MNTQSTHAELVAALDAMRLNLARQAQHCQSLSGNAKVAVGDAMAELLLALIKAADKLEIDLMQTAEQRVEFRAANLPRLVKPTGSKPNAD